MRGTSIERFDARVVGVVAVAVFLFLGCSDTGSDGDDGRCGEGETYDSEREECVDEGSGSATGGGGDAVGGGASGSASGGSGDASSSTDGYAGGACEPRSKYLRVFKPNVYFTVDTSESMEGNPWDQAKTALDRVAEAIATDMRVGLSAFPQPSAGCSSKEFLALGAHDPEQIKSSYASVEPAGGTPTGIALNQVRAGGWLEDYGDENADARPTALILITDGEPNDEKVCDQTVKDPIEQAAKLAEEGVSVYVVGFKSEADPATLNALAEAGGTDAPGSERFYAADGPDELANALLDITGTAISCSFSLNPAPPEGSTVNVSLGGESVPDSGYEFDQPNARVTLTDEWCETAREQAREGTTLNLDVGCPDCVLAGANCESDSDCCNGFCEDGVCTERCRNAGETCESNGECCTSTCGRNDEDSLLGECIGG